MSLVSTVLRLLGSLVRLVVFAFVVGAVVAVLLPGGPLDVGRLDVGSIDGHPGDPAGARTATRSDQGAVVTPSTPPPRPRGSSPWGKEVLVVAVHNTADPSRNVTAAVADALSYWERNVGYGEYPAEFRLRPDASDPDVVVWYNESIDCPDHANAIGCAPLIQGTARVDPPVRVQIEYDPDDNRLQVTNTVIHEFGHVLGIGHCEEPYWVMASSCREPIPDAPDASERDLAFRDETISVYIDERNVSAEHLAETRAQVGHALTYFEDGEAKEFPANVSIVRVEDPFVADVTITFSRELRCGDEAVVCYTRWGRDFDGDGHLEYHTGGAIFVDSDSDVRARGWYVGSALAHQLSPGHVPPVFEEANYRERRSEWWE